MSELPEYSEETDLNVIFEMAVGQNFAGHFMTNIKQMRNFSHLMSQSIPTGYIPPGNPGDSLKKIARGVGIWLLKLPGGREFEKGRDFVESSNCA